MKSVKKLLCCLIPAKSKGIIKIETKKRYNYEAPGSSLFMYKEDEATASPYEKEWYICEAPRRTSLFMFTSIEEAASPAASPYDDLSSCSSHEVEDGTDDEARTKKLIEKEDFKIQSCRLCECKVSEISKEAWIADGATASPFCDLDLCSFHEMEDESDDESEEREQQVNDRIAMLKSRFGEFRFETDVHVDQSVEEMKSALEECESDGCDSRHRLLLPASEQVNKLGIDKVKIVP
ncbi:hypothetical protein MSG28_010024 [Choristoneura fumiferana]|uniref:Uncharacterized protein n=1 Tax=Choristoneura fumiferana TaxID=7141 RepID=A0ACC0KJZ2_CHOFU|nr:hypothetical protein MSG28_010024 [Choristoneura fumiferana]